MSEKKHTPGPWVVETAEEGTPHEINVMDTEGWFVAACCDEPGDGTVEGNAHLIAAAPDLLAACEAMIVRHAHPPTARCRECDAMRAAIAKARGI